jgi:hypothetical protein
MKINELTGVALDWAVAKCEDGVNIDASGLPWLPDESPNEQGDAVWFHPSTNWAQGGPIIEREWLDITPWPNESDEELQWQCKQHDSIDCVAFGPTPLIAAMRCYVASKLGDTIDIPEELTGETA